MKTQLIATKAFSYGGRALKPGGEFEAQGRDARLLVAIGKAAYQTRVMVAAPPPAPPPAPAPAAAAESKPVASPVAPPAPAAPAARKTPARKTTKPGE